MKNKRFAKLALLLVIGSLLLSLAGCAKECANGCGDKADPDCMAEMCDRCCDYWCGINGCYVNHSN